MNKIDPNDIEEMLRCIEEIIASNRLPPGLAGDLMSQSLDEFHQKLSKRLADLRSRLGS